MSDPAPEKYSEEEWNHIRKRFFNSILNDTEIAKLGQNVGISWPFKGSDETPSKYIEFDFEELKSVPGLIGKQRRIKTLMDILRETLAFDDPFGDMVDTVETESQQDDTFERIFAKLDIPTGYPIEFVHFAPETHELLRNEDVSTLVECVHFGQRIAKNVVVGGDLKTFLNGLAHKDEVGIAKHIPYRRGERGLHLAEAIGLIAEDLGDAVKLSLLRDSGVTLTEDEARKVNAAAPQKMDEAMHKTMSEVAKVCDWFSAEASDLEQIFYTGGSPERFFLMINDPQRERIAVQLARLHFLGEEKKKPGFFGRFFGR